MVKIKKNKSRGSFSILSDKPVRFLDVSDIHLSSIAPKSRIDDYKNSILDKIEFICDCAVKKECDFVIQNGDLTHSSAMINHLLSTLQKFSSLVDKSNIPWFAIVGNHDYAGSLDYFMNFPAGELFYHGFINPFIDLSVEIKGVKTNLFFLGFWYFNEKSIGSSYVLRANKLLKSLDKENINVAVIHQLLESLYPNVSFVQLKDLEELGFNFVLVGHDHRYKGFFKNNLLSIFQPGGVSRNTSHYDDINRNPVIGVFVFDGVTLKLEEEIQIPVKPKEQCFNMDRIMLKSENLDDFADKDIDNYLVDFFNQKEDLMGWSRILDLLSKDSEKDVYLYIKEISDSLGV